MPIIMLHYPGKVDSSSCIEKWVYCCLGILLMISDAGLCKTVLKPLHRLAKLTSLR
ncbi:unnamed protein product [Acanthoscelides obtectus]|uniref:Uncharacterized protein n=1 Tax=Acanthoscelides obtectus TaxID=200917 RepID=A0A9P0M8C5_ACAOB|nr:unnamed protein product [Acanthoscelides obtectus]CAK1659542.1 hypothetical protein AOBTE_LOCUS21520 [Acanthoscelides obtectus]